MSALLADVGRAIAEAIGGNVEVRGTQSLSGGCINDARRLDTNRGAFFLKSNPKPGALFSAEADGLAALRQGTTLVVPDVVTYRDGTTEQPGFLVTSFLDSGRRDDDFDERLGQGLAELHRTTADTFGFDRDTFCGATLQPNPRTNHWVRFYRDHRLAHQLELSQLASPTHRRHFERLFDRLDDLLGDDEPPALIHGDLWSGNLFVSSDGPALIDPAVYYAHREAELGMMTLFGGFSARVLDAYDEAFPLRPGWRERNPLYELYHLMNHATLFGGHYVEQAVAIAKRY